MKHDPRAACGQEPRPANDQINRCLPFCGLGAQECVQGRDLGFDGKTLIHPSQIEACNAAYSPPVEEVTQARKIIAAFGLPENKDKGVIQLDGRMVEKMHADMAQRTVAIADAIEAKG